MPRVPRVEKLRVEMEGYAGYGWRHRLCATSSNDNGKGESARTVSGEEPGEATGENQESIEGMFGLPMMFVTLKYRRQVISEEHPARSPTTLKINESFTPRYCTL